MKQQQKQEGIPIFLSYVSIDDQWGHQLIINLSQLEREGLIKLWSESQILAGADRAQQINQAIHSAQIILLLISADFLASDICDLYEIKRALERHRRGEAHVIPIIVRPCDWQYSLFASLHSLPRDGQPISTWNDPDEAFFSIVKDLRWLITHQEFPLSHEPLDYRAYMLRCVRDIWITGWLDTSLDQALWLDLSLQDQPDALENPWQLKAQELKHAPHILPTGTNIVQIYDKASGKLLILGEPGAGKTILLLHLARTLLDRAEANTCHPIPAIFILSSWAQKRQSFVQWLVEELSTMYKVPRQIAQQWIDTNQILPLLDGLDEVAEEARVRCVEEITAYSQRPSQTVTALVVCCRREEYQALPSRLQLDRAVSIEPLTDKQIEDYLSNAQGQLDGLRQALRDDVELKKFVRQPLMLSIFTLAYEGAASAELPPASTQKLTLHTYVTRMLTRRAPLESGKPVQFRNWLIYLAKQLHRQQETVLSVEDLQPDWLPGKQQSQYRWSTGLVAGLIIGLPSGLVIGLPAMLNSGLFAGLAFGLFGGVWIGLVGWFIVWLVDRRLARQNGGRIRPAEVISWSWKMLIDGLESGFFAGLRYWLISWLIIGMLILQGIDIPILFQLYYVPVWGWEISHGLLNIPVFFDGFRGLVLGGLGGLVFGLFGTLAASHYVSWKNIVMLLTSLPELLAEEKPINWVKPAPKSRKARLVKLLSTILIGMFVGLINGLLVDFADWLIGEPRELLVDFGLSAIGCLSIGLVGGLGLGLSRALFTKRQAEAERTHFSPNEGIRRSRENGLNMGQLAGLLAILFGWLAFWWLFKQLGAAQPVVLGLICGVIIGMPVGLYVGLLYGLHAFVQHFLLRFWLWRTNCLPWNLIPFLGEAAERLLLRKVGGSYQFVHVLLRDYFASLDGHASTKSVSPSRSHPFFKRMVVLLAILVLIGASLLYPILTIRRILYPSSSLPIAMPASPTTHVGSVDPGSLTVSNGMFYFTTSVSNGAGTYLHALDATSGIQKWIYHSSGYVSPWPPAITAINGTVYFVTSASKTGGLTSLHAFDAASGMQKWTRTSPTFSYFTVDSGIIYIIAYSISDNKVIDTSIYALDAASGTQKWTYHVPNHFFPFDLLLKVKNGIVYFDAYNSNSGEYFYALNAVSGTQRWTYHVSGSLHLFWDDFAIDNGIIYFITHGDSIFTNNSSNNSNNKNYIYVHALDAASGAQKWTYRASGLFEFDLGVDNGIVYFATNDTNNQSDLYFYALDVGSGAQKWTYHSASPSVLPTVDNGIVYLSDKNSRTNGYLHAFDVASGAQKWGYHTSGALPSLGARPLSVDKGIVYFDVWSSLDTDIYAFDAVSGVQKWTAHILYAVPIAQPIVNNGVVYLFATSIDNKDEYLYALDAASGAQKWVVHASGFFDSSLFRFNATLGSLLTASTLLTIDNGIVYFATHGNTEHTDTYLYAVDATSGARKWSYFISP